MSAFVKGSRIKSVDDLVRQDFVFHSHFTAHGWKDTLVPFGWFQNWQLHWAEIQIATRRLFHAVEKGGSR